MNIFIHNTGSLCESHQDTDTHAIDVLKGVFVNYIFLILK